MLWFPVRVYQHGFEESSARIAQFVASGPLSTIGKKKGVYRNIMENRSLNVRRPKLASKLILASGLQRSKRPAPRSAHHQEQSSKTRLTAAL